MGQRRCERPSRPFGGAAGLIGGDRADGGIWVRRAVSEDSQGLIVGDVKDHEERFVELPPSIVSALDRIEAGTADRLFATRASLWLDAGASSEYVRDQLGHADLRTTQKYLDVFRSRRESTSRRLELRLQAQPDVGFLWGSGLEEQSASRREVA